MGVKLFEFGLTFTLVSWIKMILLLKKKNDFSTLKLLFNIVFYRRIDIIFLIFLKFKLEVTTKTSFLK